MRKRWFRDNTGLELMKVLHSLDSSAIPVNMLAAVLTALNPYIDIFLSAVVIDDLIEKNYSKAIMIAVIMITADFIMGTILMLLERSVRIRRQDIYYKFKVLMRKKALELDYETMENPKMHEKIAYAERTAMLYGGIETILFHYKELLANLISVVTAVALVITMCLYRPTITKGILSVLSQPLVSGGLILIILGITLALTKKETAYFEKKHKEIFSRHTGAELLSQYLIGITQDEKAAKVIRIYDMRDMLMSNIKNLKSTMEENVYAKMGNVAKKQHFTELSTNGFLTLFSYFIVSVKILTGAISIGSFTKYTGALSQFGKSVNDSIWALHNIRTKSAFMKDFLDFLSTKEKLHTGTIPIEKRLDNDFRIEFKNVSFAYPGTDQLILKNLNCKLTLKDKMAVVGRNGAGKTTFIKLLCRLYDPTEGMITLNGIDIRKYDYEEYLTLFSVVFQDFKLFAFPIKENIAANQRIDKVKIQKCLNESGAEGVVDALPEKENTPLFNFDEEGIRVSGGELQKLAIARALYKDAPFVILDEPTAALDPISEYEIYTRFDEMVKDKTSIYISHRMSSCRFCDDIIVFDQGNIVERGNHEELLGRNGNYAKLWNAQAKYYVS
ncbi:ABC transporter, ATP-binding protein [Lachnospiraceae bacterium KM106-2]|nr:ABC transporter, ATP-binding protein [Lachnospiraceae bacterium KM106-2]